MCFVWATEACWDPEQFSWISHTVICCFSRLHLPSTVTRHPYKRCRMFVCVCVCVCLTPIILGCPLMKRCKGFLPPTVVPCRLAFFPPGSFAERSWADILWTKTVTGKKEIHSLHWRDKVWLISWFWFLSNPGFDSCHIFRKYTEHKS